MSRLYLLISEMAKRSINDNEGPDKARKKVYVLDPSISIHEKTATRIKHMVLGENAHFLRFTDQKKGLGLADITFKVPQPSKEMLLQYMGVYLVWKRPIKWNQRPEPNFNFKPIPARILESFNESETLETYTTSACKKFILNFEFLCERFSVAESDKEKLAKLLLDRFSHSDEKEVSDDEWVQILPYL